ncbi:DUF6286 domain-containing protein [Streptomyces pathocidini]|uniref:DUF6286 domain-containing protein n=1 Tax=Streptomyces pathocidini TaxID=1650571 RepID=A0ABW7V0M8_9ACTN|nr:DUF6286 domain-containing protein [Streptomyces pathocidini]
MSEHAPDPKEPAGRTGRLPTAARAPRGGSDGMEQSLSAAAYEGGGAKEKARRFWARRRVPAAILAALATAGVGLVLYDVAAVRAGRKAMTWRRRIAGELAGRPLDDPWMIGGAAAALLIGLWLLALALTPGLRALLAMRRPAGLTGGADVRGGLHRSAAALVLRDRAMEVAGVQSVRVDVGRRKVKARALAHFRGLDEVRGDLDAALTAGLRELGVARPLALTVHVRRPPKR